MNAFSTLTSIGGHWPFSYCHNLGQSAVELLRTVKSVFSPTSIYSSTMNACFYAATNQQQYDEKLGWAIQTRFHFGNQLSHYIGISIYVRNNLGRLGTLARASGLVLLAGIGTYLAYRLCLKLFGCRDLASLLHCLCNGRPETSEEKADVREDVKPELCRRCSSNKRRTASYACDTCGGSDEKLAFSKRANRRRNRRRLYSERNEDDIYESSSISSECLSADGDDECEENPTEITDLASDGTEEYLDTAQLNSLGNREGSKPRTSSSSGPQRRKWRNAAGKRTNALDDTDPASFSDDDNDSDADSVTGFSKTHSPPPIQRPQPTRIGNSHMSQSMPAPNQLTPSSKAPSVKSMSVQSVPSSQQFFWDPVCSPNEETAALTDEFLSHFANVPTGELVQRFLDGILLSGDHNRAISPGLSEAGSVFSLAADRQIGDCTEANFEQLQCDLTDLREDVTEFGAELTTYLQERSGCLQSDSRVFYRSVIVDDVDEASAAIGDTEDCATPSPSTPEKTPDKDISDGSPCHRLSLKRQRNSHESSNGSSTEGRNNNKRTDSNGSKRVRKEKGKGNELQQHNNERRSSSGNRKTSMSTSCNEKSALSLDTGYASYHTLLSLLGSCPSSPASPYCAEEKPSIWGMEKRPTDLAIPVFTYCEESDHHDSGISDTKNLSGDQAPSLLLDILPCSSNGLTPDDRDECWRKRSPSAVSLEWEDEMMDGQSPISSAGRRSGGRSRVKALDLMEFLRVYYNVDNLESVPKIYEMGRKLTRHGYRRVLLYNDPGRCCRQDNAIPSRPTHLDNLIIASLLGVAHFRWPLFKCHSFRIVPEALDASMKRCSFFAERCSTYFGSTTPDGTRTCILQCMQKLWQLHESVQRNELQSNTPCSTPSSRSPWALINEYSAELVDGMKVLMALRALETYEEILFTRHTSFPFYSDFFRIYTPASYAEKKLFHPAATSSISFSIANSDDLDIALLADTLGIRIEVFRPHSQHPEPVAVYPQTEHNSNLITPRLPLLEPSNADGSYLLLI